MTEELESAEHQLQDLTGTQLVYLSALARGGQGEARRAAEVHRNTLVEWRRRVPAFAQMERQVRSGESGARAALAKAILEAAAPAAAERLRDIGIGTVKLAAREVDGITKVLRTILEAAGAIRPGGAVVQQQTNIGA